MNDPAKRKKSDVTLPMLAAGVIAEEMLRWLDVAFDARMPLNLYSLRRITDDRIIEAETPSLQRHGLLLLAATAMLLVAAKDRACGTKKWPEEDGDD